MIVQFDRVGRGKVSWHQDILNPDEDKIVRAIKKKKCLMSKDIQLSWNDAKSAGTIFAGVQTVGSFSLPVERN